VANYTSQFQNFASSIGLPKKQGTGFNYTTPSATVQPGQRPTIGQSFIANLNAKAAAAQQAYTQQNSINNTSLATDVLGKSGGTIPVDQYGIPQQALTNFSDVFNKQIQDIGERGTLATQTAEAQAQWAAAKKSQDLQARIYTSQVHSNIPAGATPQNPGAKAVALAMTTMQHKTPYVWGGNSLKNGVDCSGLTQQIYRQLGIQIPRTTYEQAKFGKPVSRNSLLLGDLVFYNTGSGDPNGIGKNSHVAIYIGNGKVIEAANSRAGIRISSLDSPGQYSMAIQPW
jgi:cell wall-associated NlpC family hydrolase